MKDNQSTMSVEVGSQNGMALKTLPSVDMKDDVYPVGNVPEDELSDESFHLHLSEDEDDEKIVKKNAAETSKPDETKKSPTDPPSETEDDILNKFDNVDSGTITASEQVDTKLEETLLEDDENKEGDCKKMKVQPDPLEEGPEKENIDNVASKDNEGTEKESSIDSDVKNQNNSNDKTSQDDMVELKREAEEDSIITEDDIKEEDISDHDTSNEEILKTQIMDTEDLLQIVDKNSEENDKDSYSDKNNEENDKDAEENDKSSSGDNSPRSSTDKPEENEDVEMAESTDMTLDSENTNEEENESELEKNMEKEDDSIDIDESSPADCDNDKLDSDYQKIVRDEEAEMASKEKDENQTMEAKESTDNVVATSEDEVETKTKKLGNRSELEIVGSKTKTEKLSTVPKTSASKETTSADPNKIPSRPSKRSLSNLEDSSQNKKLKLLLESASEISCAMSKTATDLATSDDKITTKLPPTPAKVMHLNAFAELMQKKPLQTLTRKSLEQFCVQKMCEAICHKSEIGELRHQLGLQEQVIEMWRKEAVQLTKQTRDLEIVNKRLLHEVRAKNERDKPLIPVRITRSVGLQVRSDNMAMVTPKRRVTRAIVPAPSIPISRQTKIVTPTTTTKPKTVSAKTLNYLPRAQNATSTTPNAVVTSGTPILTAISASSVPIVATGRTSTNTKAIALKPVDKGFIDLTDEDDKRPAVSVTTQASNNNNNVRVVSSQAVKTTNVMATTNIVNPQQIMYVCNNQLQNVLADSSKPGPQKVMLKLNSNLIGQGGRLLATVPSGSTIAVTNGVLRTAQMQPVRLTTTPASTKTVTTVSKSSLAAMKHPAPLPPPPAGQVVASGHKPVPPKPHLSIRRANGGIVLSWKMPYNLANYATIASYQLYAYQETTSPPNSEMWRKVGDVKALALPMACTLTQFADGNKYHFAVRAVDVQKRMGPFSDPEQILL